MMNKSQRDTIFGSVSIPILSLSYLSTKLQHLPYSHNACAPKFPLIVLSHLSSGELKMNSNLLLSFLDCREVRGPANSFRVRSRIGALRGMTVYAAPMLWGS